MVTSSGGGRPRVWSTGRWVWLCRACLAAWPCLDARAQLTVEYLDDPIGLHVYLGTALQNAVDDLSRLNPNPGPDPAVMHARFLAWPRARLLVTRARLGRQNGLAGLGAGSVTWPTVIIRAAASRDWAQIYPFFSRIVADGETYVYPEGLDTEAARSLWMEEPPGHTVVAVDGDVVLGSAKMGPNRPGRGAHVATASFMVDPARHGQGIGRALGRYAVQWARTAGYHGMQFNAVVETNTGAVKLWQSLGFEILATVPEAFDHAQHGLVGLHVMYQRL